MLTNGSLCKTVCLKFILGSWDATMLIFCSPAVKLSHTVADTVIDSGTAITSAAVTLTALRHRLATPGQRRTQSGVTCLCVYLTVIQSSVA